MKDFDLRLLSGKKIVKFTGKQAVKTIDKLQ